MPRTLSAETIALVKASVPALETHGLAISSRMYARLFEDAAIRALFNPDAGTDDTRDRQPRALAAAVLAYARNIDTLGVLGPVVERIAQRHAGLAILPAHYPVVADALLAAIAEVLGDAATPALAAAWGEAYWFLADLLMAREAEIRQTLATAAA